MAKIDRVIPKFDTAPSQGAVSNAWQGREKRMSRCWIPILVLVVVSVVLAVSLVPDLTPEPHIAVDEPDAAAGTERANAYERQQSADVAVEVTSSRQESKADGAVSVPEEADYDPFQSLRDYVQRQIDRYPEDRAEFENSQAEQLQRLHELLQEHLGYVPENLIGALNDLDDDVLRALLQVGQDADSLGHPAVSDLGNALGRLHPDTWLSWFERANVEGEFQTMVSIRLLRRAVAMSGSDLRKYRGGSLRVLEILDQQLRAWQDQPVNLRARSDAQSTFQDICPLDGGLEFIRRWTVESPFGDEVIEMQLCEALNRWPIEDARHLAIEILATRRAGAIKGIVRCWMDANRSRPSGVWTRPEIESELAGLLAAAVAETGSSSAILYACVFAADDLLADRLGDIAAALLARRDNRYCTSLAFSLLSKSDRAYAHSVWRAWFYSADPYRISAACIAAYHGGDEARTPAAMDRMYNLAMNDTEPAVVRGSAALALAQVERQPVRAPAIMQAWMADPSVAAQVLVSLGRLTLTYSASYTEALIMSVLNDPEATPQTRHYPLFLLATVSPMRALELCEQAAREPGVFLDESLLLSTATVEAMLPDTTHQRTSLVRRALTQSEPQWVREIRLRLSGPEQRTEHRVVSYAWSSASLR
jgi:hypothetical protein